MVTKHIAGG